MWMNSLKISKMRYYSVCYSRMIPSLSKTEYLRCGFGRWEEGSGAMTTDERAILTVEKFEYLSSFLHEK